MLQPTEKFLLECVRANTERELRNTLESFLKESYKIDWLLVAKTIPYVYLKAKNFYKDFKIPKKALNKIKQTYYWHVARNEQIKHEITELAKEFKKVKIDLIFLKGAALFTTVYGDNTDLRIMSDIDILIRKKRLWQAEEVLKKMGYQATETERERQIFLDEHFHFKYSKEGIILELHWDIGEQWHWDVVDAKDLYLNMLFSSSEKIKLKYTTIKVLSPTGNLFFNCFHFDRDLFLDYKIFFDPLVYLPQYHTKRKQLICRSLQFFYEIKKMLQYYGNKVKWDNLFSLAKAAKKEYEIFTLLFLSEKVAKASIPKVILKKMKKNIFVRLYIFLCCMIRYDSLINLFLINRVIYRVMLICLYISNGKIYLLMRRIVGRRV